MWHVIEWVGLVLGGLALYGAGAGLTLAAYSATGVLDVSVADYEGEAMGVALAWPLCLAVLFPYVVGSWTHRKVHLLCTRSDLPAARVVKGG